jgi:hypothetical protein
MRLASPARRCLVPAYSVRTEVVKGGISFGSALAIAISWWKSQSVLWAIFHGFCSWFYVIYHVATRP